MTEERSGRFRVGAPVLAAAALIVAVAGAVNALDRWWGDRRVQAATRSLDAGDAPAAARALLPVVARRPTDPVSHYYLGVAYIRAGLPAAAIRHLAEAERLEPRDARVRSALGQAYRSVGTPDRALREFLEAVALDPDDPSYRVEAGNVLLDDGRVDEALMHLREAVRLRPMAADARVLLGLALCRAGDGTGMAREYHAAERIAAGQTMGELAHLLSEAGPPCATGHH